MAGAHAARSVDAMPRTFLECTAIDGADARCQTGAARLAYARVYDWLDEVLSRVAA